MLWAAGWGRAGAGLGSPVSRTRAGGRAGQSELQLTVWWASVRHWAWTSAWGSTQEALGVRPERGSVSMRRQCALVGGGCPVPLRVLLGELVQGKVIVSGQGRGFVLPNAGLGPAEPPRRCFCAPTVPVASGAPWCRP